LLTKLYIDGLQAEIKGINQRLDQASSQQEQHHREKVTFALTDQQKRCLQTFEISSYEEQKNINPRKVEGTCIWALQSAEYIRWSESSCNDLLWVSADPGCGKSVLSRSIVDDGFKISYPEVTICYFFFHDNDEQNHLAVALCSVLHQLFSQRPQLLRHAILSWEKNGEMLREDIDELWRIFTTAASSEESCKTICVFDALDECREIDQNRLVEKLQSFHRLSRLWIQDTWLKFLITSRPYDYIQKRFRAITDSFPHLHLKGEEENDQIHQEIDLVVKMRVKELAERAALSQDTQQRLEQQLLQMKHRTYLWLHLAMDDIQSTLEDSLRPAEESIEVIPQSVYEAYEKILSRVPSRQSDIARKILQIIVAARRPLTTAEMAMALGIATSPQSRTAAKAGLESSQINEKLRQLCGLFVFINNSKIYLIHQTAREFLVRKSSSHSVNDLYSWSLTDAEEQMSSVCLRYLLMEDLETDENPASDTQDFLEYSAVHWPDHVRKMDLASDQKAVDLLHRLYDKNGKQFSIWFPIFWKAVMPHHTLPTMNALHLAAFNGHVQVVKSLLDANRKDVNIPDDTGTYALIWASLNGHKKIVQLLLEQGANVDAQGGRYGNALQAACYAGHYEIVQTLLEQGANVDARGGRYGNALQAACYAGHYEIVQTLLEQGANVDARGGRYGNALHAVCSAGHYKIVQILLEQEYHVKAQREHFGIALYAASENGHKEVVQLLLEKGASVNARSGHVGTALQAASMAGHEAVARLLIEWAADVNLTANGACALSLATKCRNDDLLKLLLSSGANVETALQVLESFDDQMYLKQSALDYAAAAGDLNMVKILISAGVNVNHASKSDLRVPLHLAAESGQIGVVTTLLDANADPTKEDSLSRTALFFANLAGSTSIVQALESAIIHYNKGFKLGLCYRAKTGGFSVREVQITKRMSDYTLLTDIFHAYKQRRCQGLRRYSLRGLQGVKPIKVK
jgi:ankyrin repeat protein